MKAEEYWARARKRWEGLAGERQRLLLVCWFCRFDTDFGGERGACAACPVAKVYGDKGCDDVKAVVAFYAARGNSSVGVEELSALAQAVVRELDDKKEALVAAMRELMEEQ